MKKPTKKQLVLNHLQLHGSITSLQAILWLKAMRLADIVYRLKKQGHIIKTEMVKTDETTYAKYIYLGYENN